MGILITYAGNDVFSGISPQPFIQREESNVYYGERWCSKETLTLTSKITGSSCNGYSGFINKQNQLIAQFATGFQTLQVIQDGVVLLSRPYCEVTKIDFPSNSYNYLLPFSITLENYPQEYFSGFYGVTNPKEEWSFVEQNDEIIAVTHTTSCVGINTSSGNSNALTNAQSFVQSRSGYNGQIAPSFIQSISFNPCFQNIEERINRFSASYSIKETYFADICYSGAGILKFTTEYNYDLDRGISRLSLNGSIDGCKNGTIQMFQDRYLAFDAFGECLNTYFEITNLIDLNVIPLTKTVSEDTSLLKIGFSYLFDNSVLPQTYFNYSIKFDYNWETDIITASIDGTLKSRELMATRYNSMLAIAAQINLYSVIIPWYVAYATSINSSFATIPLNPNLISQRQSYDPYKPEIKLGATFSNAPTPPNGLRTFDYTMNFVPALEVFIASPVLNGQGVYSIFDMGFAKRASMDITLKAIGGDAQVEGDVETILKTQSNYLQSVYLQGSNKILEAQQTNKSNAAFGKEVTISAKYSCNQPIFTFNGDVG